MSAIRVTTKSPDRYLRSRTTGVLHLRLVSDGVLSTTHAQCGQYFDLGREAIPLIVGEGARLCKRCHGTGSVKVRCGTYSGYIRHVQKGEEAGPPCKAAKAAYDRAYRKANKYRLADERRAQQAAKAGESA